MAVRGKQPVDYIIVLENVTLERVYHFSNLGCEVIYNKHGNLEISGYLRHNK